MTVSERPTEPEGEIPPEEDTTLISLLLNGLEKAGVEPKVTQVDEQTFRLEFRETDAEDVPGPRQPSSDEQ